VRFVRRMLVEHRRLPRLVRSFRVGQVLSFAVVIGLMVVWFVFRPPMALINALMLIPLGGLLLCVFAVGLLTWRNYQESAEIWAENVRGRGLDSIGIGWLMDTGTTRAVGAGKAIFGVVGVVGLTIQAVWPALG
jgi:hypothetical protein